MMAASRSRISEFFGRHQTRLLGLLAALVAVNVVWVAAAYLFYPGYLDHGEPVVAMIAWRFMEGLQVYPSFNDPDQTTNLYGPLTYLIPSFFYSLIGLGVASSKLGGLVAVVLIPVVVFLTHRAKGFSVGAMALILASGFILFGLPPAIWNRPDPILALLVAISVWAMRASRPDSPEWVSSLIIGLCGGLAASLKIHAGLFILPVVLFHCWRRGLKTFMFISAVGGVTILAPFAFELFSLPNYVSWFPLHAGKEINFVLMLKVLRYSLFYLTPVVFFVAAKKWADKNAIDRAETVYFWSFVFCLVGMGLLGSKPGAGWYYFFPLLAICVDMIMRYSGIVTRNKGLARAGVAVVATVLLIVSVPVQKRYARSLHWDEARRITVDIEAIVDAFPGKTIQMGVGNTLVGYDLTFYKPLLTFAGHPYTLDIGIVMETSNLGLKLPSEVLNRIKNCQTEIWLVPKGEKPFELIGYYGNPVFDDYFKGAFFGYFQKQRSFEYFDAWACKR
jgi:hypothetical protein